MGTPDTVSCTEVARRLGLADDTIRKAALGGRSTVGYFDPGAAAIDGAGRVYVRVGAVWRSRRKHGGVYRITAEGIDVMVRSKLYRDGTLMRQYLDKVEAAKVVAEDEERRAAAKAVPK